jgi:protein involved in polysaccharide export with SLBB domain
MRHSIWTLLIAIALTLFLDSGVPSFVAASDYTVHAGDKLKIRVNQLPELSGEFTVSSTGKIFMPPIGEILVDGLSINDVSARISDSLIAGGHSENAETIVELLQSLPIFVLGDVQRPGEYPYRPGLTVLRAISLAGGHFRLSDPGLMRLERDALAARGELATLLKKVNYLLARRARVHAELENQSEIVFPPELAQKTSDPTIAQLLGEERNILSTNRETLRSQVEGFEKSRVLYEREIQAITAQIEAGKREFESVRKEFAEINSLRQKGLSSWSRELTLERTQAQLMAAEQGLVTLILRARQNIAQLEQRTSELQSERRVKLNAELQQTRLELEETRSRIETARKLMIEAEVTAPTMAVRRMSRDLDKEYSFLIVRTQGTKVTNLPADENTPLAPGDVIKVLRDDPNSRQLGAEIMSTRPTVENPAISTRKQ